MTYRKLNKIAKMVVCPQPQINDASDSFLREKYCSSFHNRNQFWQLGVKKREREMTAFGARDRFYEVQIGPIGLSNICPTFEAMIDNLLFKCNWTCL